jgi:hypothetical protein
LIAETAYHFKAEGSYTLESAVKARLVKRDGIYFLNNI